MWTIQTFLDDSINLADREFIRNAYEKFKITSQKLVLFLVDTGSKTRWNIVYVELLNDFRSTSSVFFVRTPKRFLRKKKKRRSLRHSTMNGKYKFKKGSLISEFSEGFLRSATERTRDGLRERPRQRGHRSEVPRESRCSRQRSPCK